MGNSASLVTNTPQTAFEDEDDDEYEDDSEAANTRRYADTPKRAYNSYPNSHIFRYTLF